MGEEQLAARVEKEWMVVEWKEADGGREKERPRKCRRIGNHFFLAAGM